MHAPSRLVRLVSTLGVCVLVACSPTSSSGTSSTGSTSGNRIVTPPAAPTAGRGQPTAPAAPATTPLPATTPSATVSGAAPRLRGEGLSSAELYAAYRAILDTYVDPVDDTQLIKAATNNLRQGLQTEPALPMLTLPLSLASASTGNPDRDWQAFGDAYDSLLGKLPQWAQTAHPDWMVLRSMADSLHDGHTSFMTPDEAKRRNETSFAGIGVLMSRPQDNQPPLIAEIFPNSPASTSGLKRGDRIVAVDGQDVTSQPVSAIAGLIRGAPGSRVRVQVRRLNAQQLLEFTMSRAVVQVDQVFGRQVPNQPIGYLRIRSFGDPSVADQVLGVLDQGRQRGIHGWVVDLRGNPGGSLSAILSASAAFLNADHSIIGYQVDRQRHQTPLDTQPLDLLAGSPVVVLVDRDSASGAEILAAALQESKLATLVGSKTAGNVGVATQLTLPDDSVLQITEQRFVSPAGAQIDGVGVTPDVVVDLSDQDLENDRDPQLARALELVVNKLTSP